MAVTELRILTWFWQQPGGRSKYTAEHVNIWASMVRRHISMPHRIACVTRETSGLDSSIEIIEPPTDFEDVRIPSWGENMPQCLRRLAMFRPDAAAIFGDRFVNMDLDCVIGGSLDPLFDRPADFMMYRGTSPKRPYNGSMLMMTAGARPQVYTDFTPEGAAEAGKEYVGSDQAWIAHKLGWGEKVWGAEDGVYWRANRGDSTVPPRVVFFPGKTKPWDHLDDAWIAENYRHDRRGRCLVLGYGETLWTDVAAALDGGAFDAVVASPEAADHWPDMVDFIARSDFEADEYVRMQGFDEAVFCGRTERRAA